MAVSLVWLGLTIPVQAAERGRSGTAVTPLKALRDANLVRQQFDYSCGAAALATLLRFGLGDEEVGEQAILNDLFSLISEEEAGDRRREGFSLLDLQRVAQARGYKAQGFRLEPQYLKDLAGPVIVFIAPRGYAHFAVLKGVRGDRVYLADPSRGNIRVPVYTFINDWAGINDPAGTDGTGVIFAVEPPDDASGGWQDSPLSIGSMAGGMPRPELMSARELLAVGRPFRAPAGAAR